MALGFSSGSEMVSDIGHDDSDDYELEAFNKLLILEKDLMKLKDLLGEVKKIKQCCSHTDELQEINASRKK